MKSRLIKVLIALVVALAAAGGSYWQLNFNKDWREQYAYAKGVDAAAALKCGGDQFLPHFG